VNEDRKIIKTILEYLDAHSLYKAAVFPTIVDAQVCRDASTIKSPHHKPKVSLQDIEKGDVRVGSFSKKMAYGLWM
jgi:hypothetical protein